MLLEIPELLDQTELEAIAAVVADGDFADGKRTAGFRAKRVKNNLQLRKTSEREKELNGMITKALERSDAFQRAVLPKRIMPPLISRYENGMTYGAHVDDSLMRKPDAVRTDVSVTVFLSDPADYDGGELVIQSPFGLVMVKLPRGSAVIYPSSTLHYVAPVTRGERLVAVTWVQSYVRDAAEREILHDLDRVRRLLSEMTPDGAETDLAFKTYGNLLRKWADA